MNLAEFNGTEVFVDTNIFVYALAKKHRYKHTCEALLIKVNQGTLEVLQNAKTLSRKHNLLFSDAIHAGSCDVYGIKHIASNDKDFDRVDFLKRWKP